MISPKAALLLILEEAWYTSLSISAALSFPLLPICKRWTMASTMITAPSTINPKSMAPRLIRLPLTPKIFIMVTAKSKARGITEATTRPARKLPIKSTKMNTTIKAPSRRFFSTVPMALSTSLVRSRNGSTSTPLGRDLRICSIFSLTNPTTSALFAPLSIMTMPLTTSPLPSLVVAP